MLEVWGSLRTIVPMGMPRIMGKGPAQLTAPLLGAEAAAPPCAENSARTPHGDED